MTNSTSYSLISARVVLVLNRNYMNKPNEERLVSELLSNWVIMIAETMILQEFSQLGCILEFLSQTHHFNPYVGELSELGFERGFPKLTEEC